MQSVNGRQNKSVFGYYKLALTMILLITLKVLKKEKCSIIYQYSLYIKIDQEISGDVLLELTLESLKELEVSTFGKRFKLLAAINVLREESRRRRAHNVMKKKKKKTIV